MKLEFLAASALVSVAAAIDPAWPAFAAPSIAALGLIVAAAIDPAWPAFAAPSIAALGLIVAGVLGRRAENAAKRANRKTDEAADDIKEIKVSVDGRLDAALNDIEDLRAQIQELGGTPPARRRKSKPKSHARRR